jgi:hypothetical protein
MRTYDVYRGQECTATMSVHEDGWINWECSPAWSDFWKDKDNRLLIAEALKHMRDEPVFTYLSFTICLRTAEP